MKAKGRTLFDKIWDAHAVTPETGETPAILYIDLHLLHEVTSPQAFAVLAERGLPVRRPERTVATADHTTPTLPGAPYADRESATQVARLLENCDRAGIRCHGPGDARQGIVHVTFPEQGLTRPGMTIVCGDSHTSTHGAFGALAFGIGTSEVAHVLATQTLLQRRPKTMRITFSGALPRAVTAKDMALALIQRIGAGGATGHVLEFAGEAVRALDMDGRMTLCNMAIEAGARAGMVAPDQVTFDYLAAARGGVGAALAAEAERWGELASDPDAVFDREVAIDAATLAPMLTWGTSPDMGGPVDASVPEAKGDAARERALAYMGVTPGRPLLGTRVDVVFIGSCTNGRLADLRAAARVFAGRRVADGVRVLVVPGSRAVQRQAEREGLADVFRAAGAEWREPGCSLCIAMNGDRVEPGQVAVSTSNRNFAGRQGPGARTMLASPLTAAASAVTGCVTDPRAFME